MNRDMLKKQNKALYINDTRRHIFNYPVVYPALIMSCILADGLTLFSLIDQFLKQSQNMSYVITAAVAGVLNIAAVLLAACLHNEEFSPRAKKTLAGMIIGVFLLFFTSVFVLRVASMEQMYGSNNEDLGITIQTGVDTQDAYASEEDDFEASLAQIILAVILGLEPLGTSVLCFYIGYEQSPKRKREYIDAEQITDLEKAIDTDKVMITELKADMAFDRAGYDNMQYEQIYALIVQLKEQAIVKARKKLAEHDATPEGVTHLMEGEFKEQSKQAAEATEANGSVAETKETNEVASKRIKSIA